MRGGGIAGICFVALVGTIFMFCLAFGPAVTEANSKNLVPSDWKWPYTKEQFDQAFSMLFSGGQVLAQKVEALEKNSLTRGEVKRALDERDAILTNLTVAITELKKQSLEKGGHE